MIDTILIPVDGSGASLKALRFGSDLARRYGARVVVLHVLLHQNLAEALRGLSETERTAGGGLEGLAETLDPAALDEMMSGKDGAAPPPREVLEFIAARVIDHAERTVRGHGVESVTAAVEDGDPVRRILEYAEKFNADTIVMGARGLSGLEALLLGSVSQKVCHLARCTCIAVR